MPNPSTNYYRSNRKTKKVLHKCTHCNYETGNSKIQLINHINAKHVDEADRPYQCNHCERGFAQKAHLDKHLSVIHKIKNKQLKIASISYIISITDQIPCSTNTRARRDYYKHNSIINTADINKKKHEYLPGIFIKKHDIHYDSNKGFINLEKCSIYKGREQINIKLPRNINIKSF